MAPIVFFVSQSRSAVEEKEAIGMMLEAIPVGVKGQEATILRKNWIAHLAKTSCSRHTKKTIGAMYYWRGSKSKVQRAAKELADVQSWTPVAIKVSQ